METSEQQQVVASKNKKTKIDWRLECVDTFGLLPVPSHAKDQVGTFSPETWKRYFDYRSQFIQKDKHNNAKEGEEDDEDEEDEDSYYDGDDGEEDLLEEWNSHLDCLVDEINQSSSNNNESLTTWPTNLKLDRLCMEDGEEIRDAEFVAHVWSPYEIPCGVLLKHPYHYRTRSRTVEFYSMYEYRQLDFVKEGKIMDDGEMDMIRLCSINIEDEALRFEIIKDQKMTKGRVQSLKRHLFGRGNKHVCSDFDFFRLLFASMGVFDFCTLKAPYDGEVWGPGFYSDLHKQIIAQGILPDTNDDDSYDTISWLEYAMRKATHALRPFDAYYKPPSIEDAPGYDEYRERLEEAEGATQDIREMFQKEGVSFSPEIHEGIDQLCSGLSLEDQKVLHSLLQMQIHTARRPDPNNRDTQDE
jgi:hypothetical protein